MQFKRTNIKDKDFLKLCVKLNAQMNEVVPGRIDVYCTLTSIDNVFYVVLAVDEQGNPMGMAAMTDEGDSVAEVRCVFVEPKFRGKGIAKELCLHLENVAKASGFKTIILDTWVQLEAAMKLYEKLGYERYDGPIKHEIDKWCRFYVKRLVT